MFFGRHVASRGDVTFSCSIFPKKYMKKIIIREVPQTFCRSVLLMNVKMRKSSVKLKVKEYYTAPPPQPTPIDKDFHDMYNLPFF